MELNGTVTWESTLLKSKNITWKHVLKNTDDGKLDFDLHLPLTELFKSQAKHSFEVGMMMMLNYQIFKQLKGEQIQLEDLVELLNKVGLPEVSNQIKATIDKDEDNTKNV
jgi:hypothetical protein